MLTKKTNDLIYNPEKSSVYPMSQGQKWLWFIHKIAPDHTAYNEYNAVKINSPLDIETWKATWQKIVERHGILRTTYGTNKEGEPVQIIHPTMNVPMQVIDAKNWSEERLKPEILACVDVIYDLEKDPIIRLYLFQRSATEWVQMFTIHQIASDSFSKDLFFKEFQQLYAGIPVQEPLAYTDFVNWESQMLNSPRGETLCQYWEKQLAGELPILDLPRDLPRPSVVTYGRNSHEFKVNNELLSRLKQLQSDSINLLKIGLSAFYVLLYRYTNQEDIIVNVPTENRGGKKEFKDVAGNLASLVVVRGNLEGNTTFKDLLMQVAQTVDEALKHEAYNYPWSQLVKELKLKSNFRHPLISSVMFNWRKLGWYDTEFQEGLLQIEPYLLEQQHGTPYDLCVEMIEVGNELNVRWNYNGDLFKSETIERMARHYLTLLEGIVANPETPIFQLPLLTESERHQLLIEWNNTQAEYPKDKCIHQLFEEQVEKTPDAVAVVFEEQQLTYQQLNSQANQLARYLQSLGVGPEVRVGIYLDRSPYMIVAVLGAIKAGGCYIPLEPKWPIARIEKIFLSQAVSYLVTEQKYLRTVREQQWKHPQLTHVLCLDVDTPKPSPETVDRYATRSWWDWVAKQASDRVTAGGFISSYTGQPFSQTEVDEYKNHVLKLALPYLGEAKRVMEIGCGSGEIMFAIAPIVDIYVGLDPSEVTQARNRETLAQNKHTNIKLLTGFADEIDSIEDGCFDLIILASTVQFFPGTLYLQQVIEDALALLAPGGAILLADIMDARRKEEFAQSLAAFKIQKGQTSMSLTKRNLERELYLDEDFFWNLPTQLESNVEISVLKRQRGFNNELRYRYDVIIEKERSKKVKKHAPLVGSKKHLWTRWHLSQMSSQNLG
ncbi:MAG: AMP-binding protein [Okeania sp. SIO2D1]|nr:AMP-binding protein [Okeania sp. SIO2D1]